MRSLPTATAPPPRHTSRQRRLGRRSIRSACARSRARPRLAPNRLVCEGVGGLLVPLAPGYLVRDLAAELALPLVIAASPGLGTINHTLLTIEAARAVGLTVAAVVLTPWPAQPSAIEGSNRETIEALGEVRVEVLPQLDLARPESWPGLAL